MSTAEWDVDPLGGILNSDWDERQRRAAMAASRPFFRRALSAVKSWLKDDLPNMSIEDIRLDVDRGEPSVPIREALTEQQLKDFDASIDPAQDMTPDPTDFYDESLRPLSETTGRRSSNR